MQNEKNKIGIDALWQKYQKTLELLADALERLEQKPKEIIKEVEKIVDLSQEQRDEYEKIILNLKNEIESLKLKDQNIDYWGRPKNPSKKIINDLTYEQQTEQRYKRLVQEVKLGRFDINNLTHAEAEIVNKLLNDE